MRICRCAVQITWFREHRPVDWRATPSSTFEFLDLVRRIRSERGSATAEFVVALPFLITLFLIGVRFVSVTIEGERLQYLAEGIVQAVMRDESNAAIARELSKALPRAQFSVSEGADGIDGEFTVTVRHRSVSASAGGYR